MTNIPTYAVDAANSSRNRSKRNHSTTTANFDGAEWTPAEIAKLRDLWASKLSATLIAAEMPGRTRNAVISKARTLKLPMRVPGGGGDYVRKPRKQQVRGRAPLSARLQKQEAPRPPLDPAPRLCDIYEIKRGMCRYMVDVGLYCGAATERTYCGKHARIVYQPGGR